MFVAILLYLYTIIYRRIHYQNKREKRKQKQMTEKENRNNTLSIVRPDLVVEWHPTKNGDLTPADVTPGSNRKVWWQCTKGHEWQSQVRSRAINGSRCPFCSGKKTLAGVNDLATSHPNLAKEWHPTKNGDLKPTDVTAGTRRKVWWVCEHGHEWTTSVMARSQGSGCPICAKTATTRECNNLSITHPELVKEWHPTKNKTLTPESVTRGSRAKVWWICDKGHEWEATISSRARGHGCPYCSGRMAISGVNDIATTHPEIAKEWHPTKNSTLTPEMVLHGSKQQIWWMCDKGHEWSNTVSNRTYSKAGCPYCANQKVWPGFNDLATVNPEIAKEWNYAKNGDLTPDMVLPGTRQKVWWVCKHGHEWKAQIMNRTQGARCPVCKISKGEEKLASVLAALCIPYKTQFTFAECKDKKTLPFDIGLLSPDGALTALIEYDGEQHFEPILGEENLKITQKHDQMKNSYCTAHEIPLLRIHYSQFDNIESIVKDFLNNLKYLLREESAA